MFNSCINGDKYCWIIRNIVCYCFGNCFFFLVCEILCCLNVVLMMLEVWFVLLWWCVIRFCLFNLWIFWWIVCVEIFSRFVSLLIFIYLCLVISMRSWLCCGLLVSLVRFMKIFWKIIILVFYIKSDKKDWVWL